MVNTSSDNLAAAYQSDGGYALEDVMGDKSRTHCGFVPESERSLVVFSLDDRRYALTLARVQRSIRVVAITPLPKAPAIVLGIIDVAGEVIPVIDIRKRFNHPPRDICLSDHLIIATTGRRTVALLVDETIGVIEATPDAFAATGGNMPRFEFVNGAIKLADGLILIHDLERLLSLDEETAIDRAMSASVEPMVL